MIFIALLNSIKSYFINLHTRRTFKHLDNHVLRDIGFYRDGSTIRPLSGTAKDPSTRQERDA